MPSFFVRIFISFVLFFSILKYQVNQDIIKNKSIYLHTTDTYVATQTYHQHIPSTHTYYPDITPTHTTYTYVLPRHTTESWKHTMDTYHQLMYILPTHTTNSYIPPTHTARTTVPDVVVEEEISASSGSTLDSSLDLKIRQHLREVDLGPRPLVTSGMRGENY